MAAQTKQRRVVVTGGTGFVGSALVRALAEQGHQVSCVSRSPHRVRLPSGVDAVGWDEVEQRLAQTDAVVHLAGAQAVGKRYSEEYKKTILDSRVETTKTLVSAMKKAPSRPSCFVCASAVGYYGDRPYEEPCDESAPPGDDFLAQVCVEWERAAGEAEALGVRVVRTRIGVVLGDGGPLDLMALPFRMFVGGPIGSGKQAVSWIDRRDIVRAFQHCLESETLSGAVNLVAPEATTNGELSREIAHTLSRPNWLPAPGWALKLVFGEGADAILGGQHVLPDRLRTSGFSFHHPSLAPVLKDHLDR